MTKNRALFIGLLFIKATNIAYYNLFIRINKDSLCFHERLCYTGLTKKISYLLFQIEFDIFGRIFGSVWSEDVFLYFGFQSIG